MHSTSSILLTTLSIALNPYCFLYWSFLFTRFYLSANIFSILCSWNLCQFAIPPGINNAFQRWLCNVACYAGKFSLSWFLSLSFCCSWIFMRRNQFLGGYCSWVASEELWKWEMYEYIPSWDHEMISCFYFWESSFDFRFSQESPEPLTLY